MAIYHLSMKPVRRATGRSAVAAAAYRAGTLLHDGRTGLSHDYRAKGGVLATGIVLPRGVTADWALDREALWNAAESAERRRDARTAQEVEVALPAELTDGQRRELAEALARELADGYGCAADWAVHAPSRGGDGRNHHAHILVTTREVGAAGLGAKIRLERENGWLRRRGLATSPEQVRSLRSRWADLANAALARAGHDIRIDHRSHAARDLSVRPTRTVGVHATALSRRGAAVERVALSAADGARNLEALSDRPEDVLRLVAERTSVFRLEDIERAVRRAVTDPEAAAVVTQAVMRSPELVTVTADRRRGSPRLYTTRRTVAMETEMARLAAALREDRSCGAAAAAVEAALSASVTGGGGLSAEQAAAVRHVTGPERIALVAGAAGSGKSTMLAAAREAWERGGRRVLGAALAGKAADGLRESSGIASRTLSAWAHRWERGRDLLEPGDVLVIDEAGMLGTAQLSSALAEVSRRGAKAVLAGDAEQLQPIGAGAAFRALAERCGVAGLTEIRRQRLEAHRRASELFARRRTAEGLETYRREGAIVWHGRREDALSALAEDCVMDVLDRPEGSRLALAHRRADVRDLNLLVREGLRQAGRLPEGGTVIWTAHGERTFAAGDRIAFLANDSRLGVRNGGLGTVEAVGGAAMRVRPDGGGTLEVDTDAFRAIDHGYAVTVHRAQGATADRTFALAGETMDRHLAYVAMTRHRDGARLYAARETFGGFDGLARRLSRSGLRPNALDCEGFLARRGLAGLLYRIGRGVKRALGMTGLPSLEEAFLKLPGDGPGPLPETTLTDGTTGRLRERIAATEKAREEGRAPGDRRRTPERGRDRGHGIGMGM